MTVSSSLATVSSLKFLSQLTVVAVLSFEGRLLSNGDARGSDALSVICVPLSGSLLVPLLLALIH